MVSAIVCVYCVYLW